MNFIDVVPPPSFQNHTIHIRLPIHAHGNIVDKDRPRPETVFSFSYFIDTGKQKQKENRLTATWSEKLHNVKYRCPTPDDPYRYMYTTASP